MDMSPEYWKDWIGITAASKILGTTPAYMYEAKVKYQIATQLIVGRTLYFKPDCERAAAERAAKKQQEAA